jgi:hypothetical protein
MAIRQGLSRSGRQAVSRLDPLCLPTGGITVLDLTRRVIGLADLEAMVADGPEEEAKAPIYVPILEVVPDRGIVGVEDLLLLFALYRFRFRALFVFRSMGDTGSPICQDNRNQEHDRNRRTLLYIPIPFCF